MSPRVVRIVAACVVVLWPIIGWSAVPVVLVALALYGGYISVVWSLVAEIVGGFPTGRYLVPCFIAVVGLQGARRFVTLPWWIEAVVAFAIMEAVSFLLPL